MQRIAQRAFEMTTPQPTVVLGVPDDGLDALATSEPAPLAPSEVLRLAAMEDIDAVDLAGAVAEVDQRGMGAVPGEDLNLFELLGQGVAIVGIAGEAARADDQAPGATASPL